MIGCCLTNRVMIGCSRGGCLHITPDCVPVLIFRTITLTEADQETFVLQEVDEDIERSVKIGQETREGTGTFCNNRIR